MLTVRKLTVTHDKRPRPHYPHPTGPRHGGPTLAASSGEAGGGILPWPGGRHRAVSTHRPFPQEMSLHVSLVRTRVNVSHKSNALTRQGSLGVNPSMEGALGGSVGGGASHFKEHLSD